jgi:aminoglycoside 6'-N-acetyltransferase
MRHPVVLEGVLVRLRLANAQDVDRIVEIRSTPEVYSRWIGDDLREEFLDDVETNDLTLLVIENEHSQVIGGIQWHEESDPMYRHAGLDLYIDPAFHRRGYAQTRLPHSLHA